MDQAGRWFVAFFIGILAIPLVGCKEKNTEVERPKMIRPKLPNPGIPAK